MSTAILFALRNWPVILGATIGYVLFGGSGLIAGALTGVIIRLSAMAIRKVGEARYRYLKRREIFGEEAANPEPIPAAIPPLIVAATLTAIFLGYSFAVEPAMKSQSFAAWVELSEPLARGMSHVIPSINELPSRLEQLGKHDQARGARHLLTIGWLYVLIVIGCFALSIFVASRHDTTVFGAVRSDRLKLIAGGVIFVLATSWLLYFGWIGQSGLRGRRIDGLPVIAFFFCAVVFAISPAMLICADLLRRWRFRCEDTELERMKPERLAELRALFRKQRDKADAGSV